MCMRVRHIVLSITHSLVDDLTHFFPDSLTSLRSKSSSSRKEPCAHASASSLTPSSPIYCPPIRSRRNRHGYLSLLKRNAAPKSRSPSAEMVVCCDLLSYKEREHDPSEQEEVWTSKNAQVGNVRT